MNSSFQQKSEESFQHSFLSDISGGVDNAGTRSVGFTSMTSQVNTSASAYTTSFLKAINYNLTVDRTIAKLHNDFVNAVMDLPYDASIDANTQYGDLTQEMKDKLTAFISDFGTHTSEKMTFGGYYALVTSMTENDVKVSTQRGANIRVGATVPVEGVSVSGSGSGSVENLGEVETGFKYTVSRYVYRGGQGGVDGWGGTNIDDSQALKVDLIRLHEILVPDYFPVNKVPTEELKSKRTAVGLAITNEIGSPYDPNPSEIKPIVFRIKATSIHLTDASDHVKSLCGNLCMKPSSALNNYNLDSSQPSTYKLFDYSEKYPYDWYNGGNYTFSDHDAPYEAQFEVPFEKIGDSELNVLIDGYLLESDKGSSNPDPYNLPPLTIKLGGTDPVDYWVDLNFGLVTHETVGNNETGKDGDIHVYVDTDWVS